MLRVVTIASVLVFARTTTQSQRPNIIFILADDLGWNDVGFHGSNQIPTPNIDALAYTGVILNNYYVTPICTPSRSALMTGKYPIHTGMQHTVLLGAEARGLPLTEKLLPQYLQEAGYLNHIVGKWHLGSWKKEYTPTYRGFLSHLGYWTGHQDYNDHTAMETGMWGLDMRRNLEPAFDLHGKHSTEVFTREAVKIINSHPVERPLFLYLAHAAVHSGNDYNPLCARDVDVINSPNITDYHRRRFAGLLKGLDDSVGQVVEALRMKGVLHNSIIVFSTDNGGPAHGFNLNAASNWPLRGVKNTLWEGGIRGAGLVWSPLLGNMSSRVSTEMMHITDWLPTLLSGAGVKNSSVTGIDGMDMWKTMTQGSRSEREEVLHNIDDIWGSAALTVGDWKIVAGTNYKGKWDHWYGPSGRDERDYDAKQVITSLAGKAVQSIGQELDVEMIINLRKEADINCRQEKKIECRPIDMPCLFNVKQDPCEYQNMAERYPLILKHLEKRLAEFNSTAIPPGNLPVDKKGDPKNFHNVWTNFGDYFDNKIVE